MRRTGLGLLIVFLLVVAVIGAVVYENTGARKARRDCIAAVVREFEQADRVLQQPSDLDGFCAAWHDHPPGIGP